MSESKITVMAVGAHPDDIEGFFGGTLIKYHEQGHRVHMVIATDGRRGGPNPGTELALARKKEAINAAAHIGVEPLFLDFEDGRLIYSQETYEKVIGACHNVKPDIVITHDANDYHPDHRAISRLTTDAAGVPVLFGDTLMGIGFEPEFFVDITAQVKLKNKMLVEHKSQNPSRMVEMKEVQARFRALQSTRDPWGVNQSPRYAEAFRLYKRIGCLNGYELLPK